MDKKTPLYEQHLLAGGKIVPFAGYLLPIQYAEGVIQEHLAVRERVGLFDVSHMGEATVKGPGALATLQRICTNDLSTMAPGRVRYSPVCYEDGGIVDDVLVYMLGEESYLVVLNASNAEKDVDWLRAHLLPGTELLDISDQVAQIALQGPRAQAIIGALATAEEIPGKNYTFVENSHVAGIPCLLSRTGYTGEDGFELYCAPEDAPALWEALLARGQEEGMLCCGLGARDTLRLEAGMPLYGHELSAQISPLEAGLAPFVKLGKEGFIGREALAGADEPSRIRVGLEITGRGIAREECEVYAGEKNIGRVTSGTHAPYLQKAIAMALVEKECAQVGTELIVDVRGRRVAARVVPLPFYNRNRK